MTKAELVDYVAERVQLPKYQAEAVSPVFCRALWMRCERAIQSSCGALAVSGSTIVSRVPDATRKQGTRCRFRPPRSPGLLPGKPSERG